MSDFEPSDYLNLNKPLRKYDDVFAAERVSSPSNHQFCIYSQLHTSLSKIEDCLSCNLACLIVGLSKTK